MTSWRPTIVLAPCRWSNSKGACAEGRIWTALASDGNPVGFAITIREADTAYLHEMDVHPAHQRKGLGRRLIGRVVDWAQSQRLAGVTLTTFEHLPWNAPYYLELGFRKLKIMNSLPN
jgi:GNAT superfamily N-acetyltransferase